MADNLKKINLFDTNQAFLNHIPEENEVNLVNIDNDSTFKERISTYCSPNYAAGVSATISNSVSYTCPSVGYIVLCWNNTSTASAIKINNVQIGTIKKLYLDGQYLVDKGDVIGLTDGSTSLSFYPLKGV